jgi:hypothetical protein
MNIEEILKNIPDKFQHRTTTSHKFKTDVFNFFNKPEFKNSVCLEFGSNLGYSTKVLSYLFKEVVGFNKESAVEAVEFNKDRPNVKYYTQDIYNTVLPINYGDVFFVDAVHTYFAVIDDTMRGLSFKSTNGMKKYFIYDDVGTTPEIKQALDDLTKNEKIEMVKPIGYAPNESFIKPLTSYEGFIYVEK